VDRQHWLRAALWCLVVFGVAAGFRAIRGQGWRGRVAGAAALLVGLAVCAMGVVMAVEVLSGRARTALDLVAARLFREFSRV
jgi:hypothetical protein